VVLKEKLDHRGYQGREVMLVLKARLVQKVNVDLLGLVVKLDNKVGKVNLVQEVHMENKDLLVNLDHKVKLDQLDQLDLLVL